MLNFSVITMPYSVFAKWRGITRNLAKTFLACVLGGFCGIMRRCRGGRAVERSDGSLLIEGSNPLAFVLGFNVLENLFQCVPCVDTNSPNGKIFENFYDTESFHFHESVVMFVDFAVNSDILTIVRKN